jgi:hypothetical protein
MRDAFRPLIFWHVARVAAVCLSLLLGIAAAGGCAGAARRSATAAAATLAAPQTLGAAGDAALATLERHVYVSPGHWSACWPGNCGTLDRDWGADALTYTVFLRWKIARDASIAPLISALTATAPRYGPCRLGTCREWSDVPMWDSVAAGRAYEITRDPLALTAARAAFALVDGSNAFALGACPTIDYQIPGGGSKRLKTLETDSNYIKAALVLLHWTGDHAYLQRAEAKYAAVRQYFLDPVLPLYTTYVFDTGGSCSQVPHRFYASVNGNMIYAGLTLAQVTGNPTYLADAVATAQAVAHELADPAGFYENLQADNDVAEPLVEAMYDLATEDGVAAARAWLLTNAAVAVPGPAGPYGRFFGGPAPVGQVSAWSMNGGLALAIAAGQLDPSAKTAPSIWQSARYVPLAIDAAPSEITFHGSAIALIGTIGAVCCEAGHVRVFIDGRETVDGTGIWQDKSPAGQPIPRSILFSWRWPTSGDHTIAFEPGIPNPKEGGSAIHLDGYDLVP